MVDIVHSNTKAKLAYHTDGNVSSVLDDLMEIGVDILNPVQVSAAQMDSKSLKKYVNELVFWGVLTTHKGYFRMEIPQM